MSACVCVHRSVQAVAVVESGQLVMMYRHDFCCRFLALFPLSSDSQQWFLRQLPVQLQSRISTQLKQQKQKINLTKPVCVCDVVDSRSCVSLTFLPSSLFPLPSCLSSMLRDSGFFFLTPFLQTIARLHCDLIVCVDRGQGLITGLVSTLRPLTHTHTHMHSPRSGQSLARFFFVATASSSSCLFL